jgi:hypothetical protein
MRKRLALFFKHREQSVGVPIAKWFLIAGIVLGIGVALLLRYLRKRPRQKTQTRCVTYDKRCSRQLG